MKNGCNLLTDYYCNKMNRIYKFETIDRVTREVYPEEYWRMGTITNVKKQYETIYDAPNLLSYVTYLNNEDEHTFVVTLNLKGHNENTIIGRYKVWVLIRKLEMLDKRISYSIRIIN